MSDLRPIENALNETFATQKSGEGEGGSKIGSLGSEKARNRFDFQGVVAELAGVMAEYKFSIPAHFTMVSEYSFTLQKHYY